MRTLHIPLLLLLVAASGCSTDTTPSATTTPTTTATPTTTQPSTFTVTWNSPAFPATTVGSTSSTTFIVALSNTGTNPVAIGSITDTNFQVFPWTTTCALNGFLLGGTTCSITTQFKPSALGEQAATLVVNANAQSETLAMTGTGTQVVNPQLSITPTSGSATTLFSLTLTGATPSGQVLLHTSYTPAPGNAPVPFATTPWTTDASGQLTVTSSHDSPGTFENWFVDTTSGLSSNHVFSVVQ